VFVALAAFVLASVDHLLLAQFGGGSPSAAAAQPYGVPSVPTIQFAPDPLLPSIKLKEPTSSRVYQRDINGKADLPVTLDEPQKGVELTDARIVGPDGAARVIKVVDGKVAGVPAGGPYAIECHFKVAGQPANSVIVHDVYVGDLWVLAGQSNMEGLGDLVDVTPPHAGVMLLGMDGKWRPAEEPLHWLVDSPDPVHSGNAQTRAARSAEAHKTRKKGAGLGLPFAAAMVESTGVPIGLVACAHGGTSMAEWNPAKKDQGGHSLYGSMLRQVKLAGGKVNGVLWYQGETDGMSAENVWKAYPRVFTDFIAAVRSDLGEPELTFYFVQIGRFVVGAPPKGWNAVQDAQRVIPDRVPNTAVVSVIDLDLDDGIHVGTQGLKRAGQRLARIAQRELFGQLGATTPTLDRVIQGPHNTLVVKFKGVNMSAPAEYATGRVAAGGRMMGAGGMQGGGMGASAMRGATAGSGMRSVPPSPLEYNGIGLKPDRHIAGFSIRKEDGTEIPLIYEACVGTARDTVILKLAKRLPEKASLWYGYGLYPYCNLTDSQDMAVPVFGPIALDELAAATPAVAAGQARAAPIKLLIITGDHGHAWKDTTKVLSDVIGAGGKVKVDVTTVPSKDLTDENLGRYDVLLLNYKDTPSGAPETRWSEANKQAFLKAVREGKGLVVYHHASSAFTKPNWEEFEKAIAGGWRSQGFHGPPHEFTVQKTDAKHAISEGLPAEFKHTTDELYQNSVMVPGSIVLATAYSDPKKPRGTGKDEPVIWVNTYGQGRVYENVLGHSVEAMSDPIFRDWMRRGVIWAATGKVD
jgi:sialate O-acetylesterase